MNEYRATISIVTYNNEDKIGNLLDSIKMHTKGVSYHIYVIDNCSTDQTIEVVKSKMENVTLIENKENVGFGKGHNTALDLLNSKYHAYINPDIVFKDDIINNICRYLDSNLDIGIITPKVLYPDGQVQLLPKKNPKLIYLLSRRINLSILKKYREEYEMMHMDPNKKFDIEFSTGCFIFTRTELIKKIKGFDENFFLYFEDADLSRRIREFSRVEYNPDFMVFHHWERGSAENFKLLFIHIKSMFTYMKKWKTKTHKRKHS